MKVQSGQPVITMGQLTSKASQSDAVYEILSAFPADLDAPSAAAAVRSLYRGWNPLEDDLEDADIPFDLEDEVSFFDFDYDVMSLSELWTARDPENDFKNVYTCDSSIDVVGEVDRLLSDNFTEDDYPLNILLVGIEPPLRYNSYKVCWAYRLGLESTPEDCIELADIVFILGSKDDAINYWNKCEEHDPDLCPLVILVNSLEEDAEEEVGPWWSLGPDGINTGYYYKGANFIDYDYKDKSLLDQWDENGDDPKATHVVDKHFNIEDHIREFLEDDLLLNALVIAADPMLLDRQPRGTRLARRSELYDSSLGLAADKSDIVIIVGNEDDALRYHELREQQGSRRLPFVVLVKDN